MRTVEKKTGNGLSSIGEAVQALRATLHRSVTAEVLKKLKRIGNKNLAECVRKYRHFLPSEFFDEVADRLDGSCPRGRPYELRCLRESSFLGIFKTDEYRKAVMNSIVLSMYKSICDAIADDRMKVAGRRSKSLVASDRIEAIFGKTHEWVRKCCREAKRVDCFPVDDIFKWEETNIEKLIELYPTINSQALRRLVFEEISPPA